MLVVAGGVSLALYGRAITERLAIPSAALFLVAAAAISDLVPRIHDEISFVTVERIGVVALIVILFEGGLDIGWGRFRSSAVPILSLGVVGTFASAALIAPPRTCSSTSPGSRAGCSERRSRPPIPRSPSRCSAAVRSTAGRGRS